MATGNPVEDGGSDQARISVPPDQAGEASEARGAPDRLPEASFPVSVRGYDRGAVDAYVNRVRHLVAELEVTRSPEAAVKHALARVGEHTKSMLERAGETVEAITVGARQEADQTTARADSEAAEVVAKAKAEAAELVARARTEAEATVTRARSEAAEDLQRSREQVAALRNEAEARMRQLEADTESIRQERSRLLADIRQIATRVDEVATAADARFSRAEAAEQPEAGVVESEATGEDDASEVTEAETSAAESPSPRDSAG